ncbi:hypothetical protein NK6_7227 [Bradyrhizobium diazoefficiens]|uniref:Uncharacterized protein n=1 Tax=Bradyrhizobium diazoefficiens TaxID=1355477 RepID=A0A0E4FWX5_9BRAD|nr:hypothetical protein NK6_7227 [Bradyrhizobium diazoefficiens]
MQWCDGEAGKSGHRDPRMALRPSDGYAPRHGGQAQI